MHKKSLSRKQKIDFLKNLEKGKANLQDLPPLNWETFHFKDDGLFHSGELHLTLQEFEKYVDARPRMGLILFTEAEKIECPFKCDVTIDFSID